MTRATQIAHAVTALREARAADTAPPEAVQMRVVVFEDNGGGYQWTIVAGSDERLVVSPSFASDEKAWEAARVVHAGAASASFAQLDCDSIPAPRATYQFNERGNRDRPQIKGRRIHRRERRVPRKHRGALPD